MTVVEIRGRRPDGSIEIIGRVGVPRRGGPAVPTGVDDESQRYLESMLGRGIQGPDGWMLHLSDGERFVAALPQAIRGSRLWAARLRKA